MIQNKEAHNAGITCMSLMVDDERNVFVLTGSYDKVVKESFKIWLCWVDFVIILDSKSWCPFDDKVVQWEVLNF